MAQIEWTEKLEIGIGVIDGQHRRIVDYINDLHDLGADQDRNLVARVIDDLVDYTYSHFAFEEALMEEAGYEHLAVHRQTHQSFRARVDQLRQKFDRGEDVAQTLGELLEAWLIGHIMSDDSSYASLVRERMPRIAKQHQGSWLSNALRRCFNH